MSVIPGFSQLADRIEEYMKQNHGDQRMSPRDIHNEVCLTAVKRCKRLRVSGDWEDICLTAAKIDPGLELIQPDNPMFKELLDDPSTSGYREGYCWDDDDKAINRLRNDIQVLRWLEDNHHHIKTTGTELVTLDQCAAMVARSLETYLKNMPRPTVKGGGGKPHLWSWPVVRPWLEKKFGIRLPEHHPACRVIG